MPETPSADGGSIPAGVRGVKRGLSQDLADLPIKNREISLILGVGITGAQIDAASVFLFAYQRRAIIETNFKLGDLWNQSMLPENAEARREWLAAVKARLKPDAYERFEFHMRRCGWVAGKWHPMRRDLKGTWTHYVTHRPGETGKADVTAERKPLVMTFVSEEVVDGMRITRGTTPSGLPFVLAKKVEA